jgi:hypothetical protein
MMRATEVEPVRETLTGFRASCAGTGDRFSRFLYLPEIGICLRTASKCFPNLAD